MPAAFYKQLLIMSKAGVNKGAVESKALLVYLEKQLLFENALLQGIYAAITLNWHNSEVQDKLRSDRVIKEALIQSIKEDIAKVKRYIENELDSAIV